MPRARKSSGTRARPRYQYSGELPWWVELRLEDPGTEHRSWDSYLRSRTTPRQREILRHWFVGSRTNKETRNHDDLWVKERAQKLWYLRVLAIEVDLKPAGRAVLRHPENPYHVEIQWIYHSAEKAQRPKTFTVVGEPFLYRGSGPYDPEEYYTAFLLRMAEGEPPGTFARVPRRRPEPGKPLDTAFYQQLLATYEQLVKEGYRSPAAELARRMDENRSTVKSWLHRGRKLLDE
jgi:hypothetical protein